MSADESRIRVLRVTEELLDDIVKIENECFFSPWSRRSLAGELENEQAHFLAAVFDGETAGYIGAQEICGECYITNVAVLPQFRRRGIARLLVGEASHGAIERGCGFITLEVRRSNDAAITLYKSCGFEVAGERRGFYENPHEDALIMTRYFDKTSEGQNTR